jgi:PST family polysaccharide transporter
MPVPDDTRSPVCPDAVSLAARPERSPSGEPSRAISLLARLVRSPIARNASALYAVRFATFVLPLVSLPYLARTLEVETFGVVTFAQSFAAWLTIVVEYGFSLSATREVARHRANPAALSDIVTGVIGAKAGLTIMAVVIAFVAIWLPSFRGHTELAILALLLAVVQGMSPIWFFQGIEQLRVPAACEVCARVVGTCGIFLLVRSPSDAWIALVTQLVGSALGVAVSMVIMLRLVRLRRPSWRATRDALRRGAGMFLLTSAISLYTAANTFILGLFATAQALAFFGGVERLARAAAYLIGPLSQALFPRMSFLVTTDRTAAARLLRRSAVIMGAFSVATAGALFAFAPLIVRWMLGPAFSPAVPVLRTLSFIIPLVAAGNLLGIQWMLPIGLDRQFSAIVISAGALNLVLAVVLAPRLQATGMAIATTTAEAFVAVAIYTVLRWRRQLPTRAGGSV